MKWILIGTLLGSILTSQHDTEEACEGRKALLMKEKNVKELQCVKPVMNEQGSLSWGGGGHGGDSYFCCRGDGTCGSC